MMLGKRTTAKGKKKVQTLHSKREKKKSVHRGVVLSGRTSHQTFPVILSTRHDFVLSSQSIQISYLSYNARTIRMRVGQPVATKSAAAAAAATVALTRRRLVMVGTNMNHIIIKITMEMTPITNREWKNVERDRKKPNKIWNRIACRMSMNECQHLR